MHKLCYTRGTDQTLVMQMPEHRTRCGTWQRLWPGLPWSITNATITGCRAFSEVKNWLGLSVALLVDRLIRGFTVFTVVWFYSFFQLFVAMWVHHSLQIISSYSDCINKRHIFNTTFRLPNFTHCWLCDTISGSLVHQTTQCWMLHSALRREWSGQQD